MIGSRYGKPAESEWAVPTVARTKGAATRHEVTTHDEPRSALCVK